MVKNDFFKRIKKRMKNIDHEKGRVVKYMCDALGVFFVNFYMYTVCGFLQYAFFLRKTI